MPSGPATVASHGRSREEHIPKILDHRPEIVLSLLIYERHYC